MLPALSMFFLLHLLGLGIVPCPPCPSAAPLLAQQLPKNSCPWDSGGYLILELLFPALGLLHSSRSPKEGKEEEELREHSLGRDMEQVLPLRSGTGNGTVTPRRWHSVGWGW